MKKCGFILGTLLFLFFFNINVNAKNKIPNVLFVSSYTMAFDTVSLQINGVKDVLNDETNLDYEFMDSKRLNNEKNITAFKKYLEMKCQMLTNSSSTQLNNYYDAVLVADDNALQFAMNNNLEGELFYQIPTVFLAINNLELANDANKDPYITGICEDFSYKETLELAAKFTPSAKNIVCFYDNTSTGVGDKAQLDKIEPYFVGKGFKFEMYNGGNYTFEELKTGIFKNIDGSKSIVFVTSLFEDKRGETKTMAQMCEFVSSNINAPVYRASVGGIGQGIAGGIIVSYEEQGRISSNMVKDILSGKDINDIELVTECPKETIFDANVLTKFGIKLSLVPKDSELINHNPSFFEENKVIIISVLIAFCILGFVSVGFFIDGRRKNSNYLKLSNNVKQMRSLALHDPLTKLPNRRNLFTQINNLIYANKKFAVAVIDVDSFKEINDTFGHLAGDTVLVEISNRFNNLNDDKITFARFGGDEFIAIVVSDVFEEIDDSISKVFSVFKTPFLINEESYIINVSIGVSIYPSDAKNIDDLILRADDAMYEVKKENKNSIMYYQK